MKLGTQDIKLNLGNTQVEKVYLGTNLVYTKPVSGVLAGYARFAMPSPWTVDGTGLIYTRPSGGEQRMPYRMMSDGGMATKYTSDNDGAFYYISDEGGSEYRGMVLHYSGLQWLDNTGSAETSPQPNEGDFVVIRRVGTDTRISITSDFGSTYTDVKIWPSTSFTYVLCETFNSLKIYDPQQQGFTPE